MESLSRLIVSHSPRGWVGGQQAHLSSGLLGFAEGSSTASLCGAPLTFLAHTLFIQPLAACYVLAVV